MILQLSTVKLYTYANYASKLMLIIGIEEHRSNKEGIKNLEKSAICLENPANFPYPVHAHASSSICAQHACNISAHKPLSA